MLRFRGGSALSSFRLKKLADEIKILVPQVSHISAEYWHFCSEARGLEEKETTILEKLLTYGAAAQKNTILAVNYYWYYLVPEPSLFGHQKQRILPVNVD